MCGIFGIITKDPEINIFDELIEGLTQLQNRGYDSTGLGFINEDKFSIYKKVTTNKSTSLEQLKGKKDIIINNTINKYVGIGHNRWATHGIKNKTNAHPHTCQTGTFMIVHNGIIENYNQIKSFLKEKKYIFYSDTDTEVIVNLINYHYYNSTTENTDKTFNAIKNTISELEGTYGLIIMNINEPNKLFVVKNGSPILVGMTDDYAIVTSEQSGFCNKVNNYIILNNDDICIITNDTSSNKIDMKTYHEYKNKDIIKDLFCPTPEPYQYWIEKEINEQPQTIMSSINMGGRIKTSSEVKLGGLEDYTLSLKNINHIILLGCGTSYNSSLYGSYYLKKLCNFDSVQVIDGADFDINDINKKGKTALILVSQSGETRDLYRCIEMTKNQNVITIGIINVVDSLIAREVDCGIYCNAGREMSVASTKVFTSQVVCLSMLSVWFSQIQQMNENTRIRIIRDLHNLSNDFKIVIENVIEKVKELTKKYKNYNNLFVLGKSTDEYVAREGSLKIKEVSYIHSEAYSSSALKHGPFALLDEYFPTIIINTIEEHNSKINGVIEEVYSKKSPIILITNKDYNGLNIDVIKIPYNKSYSSLLANIVLQLFAYYFSVNKGINPDIPKNLAKVITVD